MKQNTFLKMSLAAVTAATVLFSASLFAKGDVFVDQNSVAIKGYDPVSYFVSSAAKKGQAQFSHVHAGNTWMFSSAANKQAFIANPVAYLPQYGGHCAFAASKNSIAPVDPHAWTVRGGKLYLNYSLSVRDNAWKPDVAANIVQSDANWPTLATQVTTR